MSIISYQGAKHIEIAVTLADLFQRLKQVIAVIECTLDQVILANKLFKNFFLNRGRKKIYKDRGWSLSADRTASFRRSLGDKFHALPTSSV